MKHSILLLILVFSCITVQAEKGVFKIGAILPLSGSAAVYGRAAQNGIEMALAELGSKSQLKVLYEDDQFQSKVTVGAFNKLVGVDKVDLTISLGSTPTNAVAELAQKRKALLIGWASDRRVSYDRSFVFRSYPSGFFEGALVSKTWKKKGLKRLALVISQNDYAESWESGITGTLTDTEIVISEEFPKDVLDYKALLLKAKNLGIDSFATCLNPLLLHTSFC